jgi:porin
MGVRRGAAWRALACGAAACTALAPAAAGAGPVATGADLVASTPDPGVPPQPAEAEQSLWTRSTLLGDLGGLRTALGRYGISLGATEVSEVLGNLRGGLARGATYDGLATMTLGVDTQKAFGLAGGTFNASALQIRGRDLSPAYLGTLNTASSLEAANSLRLWELWYQQSLFHGRLDIKVGQQSLDQEFIVSQYAQPFMNAMFGWPALASYDLPAGGPVYPLSDLGVRVRGQITPALTVLAGVFDGNPTGNNPDNRSGTNFNLHNGALYIGELQYAINQPTGDKAPGAAGAGLPGTYKIGLWYNNERFADQRFDNAGLSLANPASSGAAATHRGNFSVYAVADQMIWRPAPDSPRSIGVFGRVMGAPGDRNLVEASANAGIVMKAPFAHRDDDTVGLAVSYIKVGTHVRALDRDALAFNGGPYGVRSSETTLEATYQYQIAPWWQLQGDLQYTFNAGAGQNPSDPSQPLRNTFMVGLRTNLTF